MQRAPAVQNDSVINNLSNVAVNAIKELEATKLDLREKELQLKEIAEISNQKIKSAVKVNKDLQGKVEVLQELSSKLQEQNDELGRRIAELKIKEKTYNSLNNELRGELDKITEKEKELEIREKYLENVVEEKSQALSKTEKLATIGDLTSKLAHDLRNPLSVIKTTLDLMKAKQTLKVDDRLKYQARLDRSVAKMSHLVEDVLNFVKVSELSLQEIALSSIIDSAIDSLPVPPEVEISKPKTSIILLCDYRKLEAAFSNILTNAIQAMENQGTIKIRTSSEGKNIVIEFEDSGSGVPDSVKSQIFEPLFTTRRNGTGLGLSICQNIVEKHGGNISVKNNPTVFTITLPTNV